MRKSVLFLISCLFIYSCSDDFYIGEDNTIDPENIAVVEEDIASDSSEIITAVEEDMAVDSSENSTVVEEDIPIDTSGYITFQDKVIENGSPVEGAIVAIYGNNKRYFDSTNSSGQYSIEVPTAALIRTGFISLSIFHPEYKSINVSYKAPLQANSTYDSKNISTTITKCEHCLQIMNNNYSELYHLGDNSFAGPSNSQFQKASDGVEVSFNFINSASRSKLKLSFEAKGLDSKVYEIPSTIQFGDQSFPLHAGPRDGSYQQYFVEFENKKNIETIIVKSSSPNTPGGDVDDWEFTSFYIEGLN